MKLKTLLFASITSAAFIATATAAPFMSIHRGNLATTTGDGVTFYVKADSTIIQSPVNVLIKDYEVANGVTYVDPSPIKAKIGLYYTFSLTYDAADISQYDVTEEGISVWLNGNQINNCTAKISSGSSSPIPTPASKTLTLSKDANGNYSCRVS